MSKRFTDTEKWSDDWFYGLSQIDKLFWMYLLDRCDHAGLWKADWLHVEASIGGIPTMENFGDRIIPMSRGGYFWVPKFLIFQYGTAWMKSKIKQKNNALKRLKDLNLLGEAVRITSEITAMKPLPSSPISPLQAPSKPPRQSYGYGNGNGNGLGTGDGNDVVDELK